MTLVRNLASLCLALTSGLWTLAVTNAASLSGQRPNIIFILTDDQGYGDLSCHGHPVLKTPHLDRLHDEGVRFTDFHVSPTCSPTRSALLTGRHEFKNGVTHTILERERLTPKATTLAEVLKSAGYATGIFGKWHLGDEPKYWPSRRGFDEMFIHGGGGIGQTYPGSCGDAPGNTYFDPAILHNGRFVKTRGYCTDVFFAQALKWMEDAKGRRPFLAWIACNAPHAPLQVRPEDEARYAGRFTNANAAKFLGMVANIDDNVGRLLAKLSEWGIERDTLVIFMNDNGTDGGLLAGYNAGMRGRKGTAFLGGTRAASFWRWPGTLQPADCGALTAHIDFFPTLAEIVGAKLSNKVKAQVEGRSLVPLLENPRAPWPERTLFTHFGRWAKGADPATVKYRTCSVRTPRWHLVSPDGGVVPKWMLFDVQADYGEQHDLAAQQPGVVRELAAAFDGWWDSVQPMLVNEKARGPKVNPFKELYWKQLGGGPSDEDARLMDPARNPGTAPQPVAPGHQTRRLEGWTVFVSDALLAQEPAKTRRALELLRAQLRVITNVVPAAPLAKLRAVPLWFSPEYPGVRPTAEYHPAAQWLRDHGRNPAMAKAIEFTNVRIFEQEARRMPMLVLHELAHAFHDQVLGFDRADIREAYRRAKEQKSYDAVKRVFADGSSKVERAYALSDPKEYFAECTEAFFGRNDFFPFTRAELERHDPDMFRLLQTIWSP